MAGLMKLGTMPLPVDVQTLPLYLWESWRGVPIHTDAELHLVLPWARAATLLFWWLLLVHIWLIGKSLGGWWAAAVAVAFVACEPVLAAHAGLATTDVAVTACLVALAYHFRTSREGNWWRRIGWPAFWFGLAVLAKASGLVFGALCLFVIEGDYCSWWRRRGLSCSGFSFRRSLFDLAQIGCLGMGLVFLYCGSDWQANASFLKWAQQLPEGPQATAFLWLAEHLRIFSNAGEGIVRQVTHNVRGHGAYLLGQYHPRALWYYFPVLMSIKFSVPVLLAPLAWVLLRARNRSRGPWYANWACLCALSLLLFSLLCRVQIGIRFMFPLFCLGVAGLAGALVPLLASVAISWRTRGLALGILACLGWTIIEALGVWPHGLCYVNRLWGGTEDGYRLVSEANYDWGQGLKDLARWQREHNLEDLEVWYYGKDPAIDQLPLRRALFHALPVNSPGEALENLRGRRVAVSTTLVYSNFLTPSMPHFQAVLRDRCPMDRTMTFLIYDFTK
jgi:hypothetical protein